jgi:Plasma-membrane choline transporter
MGAIFVAFSTGLFAYLYLIFTKPEYNANSGFTAPIIAFAFLIGLQICNIFTTPLSSGIDAIFVASAWDPEVLRSEHPEVYAEMERVYPALGGALFA